MYLAKSYDHDFNEFLSFALDLVSNWVTNFWTLDKDTLRRCKQLVFPDGLRLSESRNVYTPIISPLYRYDETSNVILEGPLGLEPRTPCLKGRCSNRLSYGPVILLDKTLKYYANYLLNVN